MRSAIIVLSLVLAAAIGLTADKRKKSDPTPLVPVQSASTKIITSGSGPLKTIGIASAAVVDIVGSNPSEKASLKVAVSLSGEYPPEAIGSPNEVWFILIYIPLVNGQKPAFSLPDYLIDTTGVQVTDGEGVSLERVSLSTIVNRVLDAAAANMRTFIPSAPPPPPVGSPSTYYIDCSGGFSTNSYGYGIGGGSYSGTCQANPDNSASSDAQAARQAGYMVGMAIQAWRVKHHNQVVMKNAREALVFYQNEYLRDGLTFLGGDLIGEKPKSQGGTIIYRRPDRVRPRGPFTVKVPVPIPAQPDYVHVLTFQFTEGGGN